MSQALNIGMPQGLHFSWYLPFWKVFIENLGHNAVLSSRLNKSLTKSFQEIAENELCLPSKIYIAQCAQLSDMGVDVIFSPNYESPDKKVSVCPKFVMINDLVKTAVPGICEIFAPSILLDEDDEMFSLDSILSDKTLMLFMSDSQAAFNEAYIRAKDEWIKTREREGISDKGKKTIAILGHPYVLGENHVIPDMMALIKSQEMNIISMQDYGYRDLQKYYRPNDLFEPLHWISARKILAFVHYVIEEQKADAIIFVSSFACAIDEVVDELTRRIAAKAKMPYLFLLTDDHTVSSNVSVRVEAFMDMIK